MLKAEKLFSRIIIWPNVSMSEFSIAYSSERRISLGILR
jgi:hypothetical protein